MSMTPRQFAEAFFLGQDASKGPPPGELLAPEYQLELAGFPTMDAAAHDVFARAFYAAFPDLRHTIESAESTATGIAIRFTIAGTHTGPFMGIPATGRSVSVACMALMTLAGERVAHVHGIFDRLGLLQQVGVVPS